MLFRVSSTKSGQNHSNPPPPPPPPQKKKKKKVYNRRNQKEECGCLSIVFSSSNDFSSKSWSPRIYVVSIKKCRIEWIDQIGPYFCLLLLIIFFSIYIWLCKFTRKIADLSFNTFTTTTSNVFFFNLLVPRSPQLKEPVFFYKRC